MKSYRSLWTLCFIASAVCCFVLGAGQAAHAQSSNKLLGRGWLQNALPLPGGGPMGTDKALSQWWTPLPYGAAAGTLRFSYAGFDAEKAQAGVRIEGARVTLIAPGGASQQTYMLFFDGQNQVLLAPDALQYTDALPVAVAPGTRAVVRTLYSVDDPAVTFPTIGSFWSAEETFIYPEVGLSVGPSVTLDSPLMQGDLIRHYAGISRLYRFYTPGFAVGATAVGATLDGVKRLALLSVGNSHSVGSNDFGPIASGDPWAGAGWQGRAFQEETPYLVFGAVGSSSRLSADNALLVEGMQLTNRMIWQYGHNELRNNDGAVATIGDRLLAKMRADAALAASYGLRTTFTTMWRFDNWWNTRPESEWAETENQRRYINAQLINNYAALGSNVDASLEMGSWIASPQGYPWLAFDSDGIHLNTFGHHSIAQRIRFGAMALLQLPPDRAPVNTAPTLKGDAYETAEDTALNVPAAGVLGNDDDAEGDDLSAVQVSGPAHGTLTLNSDGSFTYTPDANFNGQDSFTYRASDDEDQSEAAATVTITVIAVNDAPDATDDAGLYIDRNTSTTINALANDSDPDGDAIVVTAVTQPANGTVMVAPGGSSVVYTPKSGYTGTDSFTYTISDGTATDTATVTVSVTKPNQAPKAKEDRAEIALGGTVTVPVLANDEDPDGDALTVTGVTQPEHGTVTLHPDGTITYTSTGTGAGQPGNSPIQDTFTYTIADGRGGTDTGKIRITVRRK